MIWYLGLVLTLQTASNETSEQTASNEASEQTDLLEAPAPRVEVRGNRRVPTSLIRQLVNLEDDSLANLSVAASQLEGKLIRAGFVLAQVEVVLDDEAYALVIDEGSVERVVFQDESALSAARANFIFELEDSIFNEEDFQASVQELEKRLGRNVVGVQIGLRAGGRGGFQLSDISKEVPELVGLLDEGRYVIVMELEDAYMSPGWGLDVNATGPDGLIAGLQYAWKDAFMEDDRIQTSASVGIRVGELVSNDEDIPLISRGGVGVEWLSGEIGDRVRWFTDLDGTYLNRQRLDIGRLNYNLIEPQLTTGITWVQRERWALEMGAGVDFRALVAGAQLPEDGPRPTTDGVPRAVLRLKGSARFLPSTYSLRRDQFLELSLSIKGILSTQSYISAELEAARSFPIGRYSEVRTRLQGAALAGDSGLIDEYRVSDYFRGLYGDRLFSSRLVKSNVELFLSLEREYLRVSGFLEGIAASGSRFTSTGVRAGGATGLGIHTLFLQTIQGSIYGVVGVLNDESVDVGINLSLTRLF